MSIVKKGLLTPLYLTMIGLLLISIINANIISIYTSIYESLFIEFNFQLLFSAIGSAFIKVLLFFLSGFLLKKASENLSCKISNVSNQTEDLSKTTKFLRWRYFYFFKAVIYALYFIGVFLCFVSFIGLPIFTLLRTKSLIYTIVVNCVFTIPLELSLVKRMSGNLSIAKEIFPVFK